MAQDSTPPPPVSQAPVQITVLQALGGLAGIIVVVGGFVGLAVVLHIGAYFMGLLFSLYWAGLKNGGNREFWPALLGAIAGVLIAWLLRDAPAFYGTPGLVGAFALLLLAVFQLLRGQWSLVINLSAMLFLTIATIPPIALTASYPMMIASIALGGAYFGGLSQVGAWFARRKAVARD